MRANSPAVMRQDCFSLRLGISETHHYNEPRMRILVAFGTRPELIKLAPVVFELRRRPRRFETILLSTAQHRGLLDQMLGAFGIRPDIDLDLMTSGQALAALTAKVIAGTTRVLKRFRPGLFLVQGDTTTAMASALAAFYQGIPVAHVEAGLRTNDPAHPFPEEINRRIIGALAGVHFAPTSTAARNLRREGVPADRIFVTGNTVVDALRFMRPRIRRLPLPVPLEEGRRLVLVTAHRRENFGVPLENICRALAALAARFENIEIAFPVHPNPRVRAAVRRILSGKPRIHLLDPLPYGPFLRLVEEADLILSDSGGLQEEAPVFGAPLLVLRTVTERPEAVRAGGARVVAPETRAILREASLLLTDEAARRRMARVRSPFGDGRAAKRIVSALASLFRPE